MGTPLWFGGKDMGELGNKLIFAISTSFWMNLIFAYPMMLGHEWFNVVFAKRRLVGGTEFLGLIDKHAWGSFIPKNDCLLLASRAYGHVSASGGVPRADGGRS